jgi:hypothetical protein
MAKKEQVEDLPNWEHDGMNRREYISEQDISEEDIKKLKKELRPEWKEFIGRKFRKRQVAAFTQKKLKKGEKRHFQKKVIEYADRKKYKLIKKEDIDKKLIKTIFAFYYKDLSTLPSTVKPYPQEIGEPSIFHTGRKTAHGRWVSPAVMARLAGWRKKWHYDSYMVGSLTYMVFVTITHNGIKAGTVLRHADREAGEDVSDLGL